MSLSPTPRQVILQEVFDEASLPTDEEIYEYALRIGIDVENEPHLLYLARDGLMQALPAGWKPCFDKDRKEIYYFNFKAKKAQWEHPLDEVYRNLVKKARTETATCSDLIDDDSRTSIKEDLKSFEEASLILNTNEMHTKMRRLEPLSPLGKGAVKKIPTNLSPLKKPNPKDILKGSFLKSPLHIDEDQLMQKSDVENTHKKLLFDETEVRKRPNSSDIRNRRNIGAIEFRHLSKQEIIMPKSLEKLNFLTESRKLSEGRINESPSLEIKGSESGVITRDEGYGTEFSTSSLGDKDVGKKELTLTGGGSVFLKSNKMKSSPSSDLVTSSFSKEELSDGLLSPDLRKSGSDIDSHPKGILRDSNAQKLSEKIVPNLVEKKFRRDELEDERKSVRFNLEKELKVTFEIPAGAQSESEENVPPSPRKNEPVKSGTDKEEVRQIEVDFDELDIDFSDEKIEKGETKIVEPKKIKSSQALVKEFKEIFDIKPKNNINIMGINKTDEKGEGKIPEVKSSRSSSSSSSSSSSRSASSQNGYQTQERYSSREESKLSQVGNLIDLSHNKDLDRKLAEKSKIDEFDATFENLVDFALKKKLGIQEGDELSRKKVSQREQNNLLDEILKENQSESVEGSEEERISVPEDRELEYLENLESQIHMKALKRRREEMESYEKLKSEKTNEFEQTLKVWVEGMERFYEQKKQEALERLKERHESSMKDREQEFEELEAEKSRKRFEELREEFLKKESAEIERLRSQLEAEQRERLRNLKCEIEEQEKKELEAVRKAFEENVNEKKVELMKKHKEDIEKIERNLEDLLSEQKSQKLKELELARENEAMIEVMRLEMKDSYQKQKNNLMKEHELLLENLRQEHALALEQLKIEFKNEEEDLKKSHMNRLDEIKMRIEVTEGRKAEIGETPRSDNSTEARVFEKVRCEKRLLEDKYKTLKEKYIRLKTEAKSTLERKKKNKESPLTTGSETEKSSSHKSALNKGEQDSSKKKQEAEKKFKLRKQINNFDYLYHNVSTEEEENLMSPKNLPHYQKSEEEKSINSSKKTKGGEKVPREGEKSKEESSGEEKKLEGNETKKKRMLFSRFKAASTSRINSNKNQNKETLSPVENLRRQLKKLEELEDQFPVNTHMDTYMRYPFTDNPQFGSSEIEFFKHRIHLERESVRQAKDCLKAQKKSFENRQRELKQKLVEGGPGTKNVIDQIYQEEKELTDMEVSVHRTRALLGEKIIRLRHLEQSLKRISQPLKKESFAIKSKDLLGRLGVRNQNKEEDRTLSDLSSYSGSSGFSSTDFNETQNVIVGGKKGTSLEQNRRHFQNNMQESSEIIQSLENLNSEIREIWEVLKKHQKGQETITMLPPPPLLYGELGWPAFTLSPPHPFRNTVITSTSNLQRPVAQQFKTQVAGTSNLGQVANAIDSSLIDRTRSLRDWLRAARSSSTPSDVISPSQVTL